MDTILPTTITVIPSTHCENGGWIAIRRRQLSRHMGWNVGNCTTMLRLICRRWLFNSHWTPMWGCSWDCYRGSPQKALDSHSTTVTVQLCQVGSQPHLGTCLLGSGLGRNLVFTHLLGRLYLGMLLPSAVPNDSANRCPLTARSAVRWWREAPVILSSLSSSLSSLFWYYYHQYHHYCHRYHHHDHPDINNHINSDIGNPVKPTLKSI